MVVLVMTMVMIMTLTFLDLPGDLCLHGKLGSEIPEKVQRSQLVVIR